LRQTRRADHILDDVWWQASERRYDSGKPIDDHCQHSSEASRKL
jgi:hypothetical protein